jgi:hypothetical protein
MKTRWERRQEIKKMRGKRSQARLGPTYRKIAYPNPDNLHLPVFCERGQ